MSKEKLDTVLVSAGRGKQYCHGSVNGVIQRASSIVFNTFEEKKKATAGRGTGELFYGRRGTMTHFSFQDAMVELEGGAGCVLYPCGAAAISNAILSFVKQGDNVLMTGGAYEPTQDFCQHILGDLGVTTTYYQPLDGEKVADLITESTSVLFLESPSSITMEVPDIPAIVKAARAKKPDLVIMIDNTWAAGILFPALQHDIDISIQAGTKYIVGHSDAMLGTAVANARCWETLRERSYLMGQMVDADTAYVAARGLRTLGVRLKQHQENSIAVAKWLSERPEVERVNHPALPECPGHEHYLRDFLGCNGLFSFVLKKRLTHDEYCAYLDNFTHFSMAYSWGGYESLVLANQPEELNAIRPAGPVDFEGTLVRLHIGLEDVTDLIEDLEQGFNRIA
ncbi:cystathionine beta-lyase [Veronia pacifica]|uniref:cysteine-S-conjugate beta-lyase n=1 Tax=Veronia pacifica TaxID=1080227 RepID=A0A1C3EIN3_9GAMM|nr:cystathionine beta-lyase [Veronia pacifica]ODA33102.1 cystathionine beta-lyase [Veronia pacifica]